jgi:branched-chain amino acid transport system substrate-binding protein
VAPRASVVNREAELRCKRMLAFTSLLPVLAVAGCTTIEQSPSDKTDIVIAASLELSGGLADVGKTYENALRLKVEQINAGRAPNARKVTLRIDDNRTDPAVATSQISGYAADQKVSAIIAGGSSESILAAVETINRRGVPTIALAPASQVGSPVADRKYIFKLAPNANHSASTLVPNLAAAGVKSIRFLATNDAYGRDAVEVMKRETINAGMKDNNVDWIAGGDADHAPAARAVVQAKADAVIVLAGPTTASGAVNALKEAQFKGRIALDAIAAGPLFLTGAAAAQEGALLVFTQTLAIDDVIGTTPGKAARKQWFQDYTARYGGYQAQASFAADAAQLIVDAVDRVGSATSREALRAALESVRTDGLSGPIRLNPGDHSGLMPQSLAMLVARNGRWRLS